MRKLIVCVLEHSIVALFTRLDSQGVLVCVCVGCTLECVCYYVLVHMFLHTHTKTHDFAGCVVCFLFCCVFPLSLHYFLACCLSLLAPCPTALPLHMHSCGFSRNCVRFFLCAFHKLKVNKSRR